MSNRAGVGQASGLRQHLQALGIAKGPHGQGWTDQLI